MMSKNNHAIIIKQVTSVVLDRKLSIIGLCLSFFSFIAAIKASNQSESIAVESGAFKRPNIHAFIDNVNLTEKNVNNIVFGAKKTELNRGLVIAPYTIKIINNGDKNLENLYVTYQYNKFLRREALERMDLNVSGSLVDGYLSRKFSNSPAFDFVTYHFPNINPSVSISIDEPFVLQKTKISDTIKLDDYKILYSAYYSIKFKLSISAALFPSQDYNFEVSVVESNDLNDLQANFTEQYIKNEVDQLRAESSMLSYLKKLLFDNEYKSVVLIYPHNKKVGVNDSVIYFPNDNAVEYKTLIYKPASWTMLLH